MKNWKKYLACLLAGVLVMAMLTACGGQFDGVTRSSEESAQALCESLGKKYSADLSRDAYAIASWMMSTRPSTSANANSFCRTADNNAQFQTLVEQERYASAFYALGVTDIHTNDDTITMGIDIYQYTMEFSDLVDLTIPLDGATPAYVTKAAEGKTEMGVAYVIKDGKTYTVTVFR